MYRAEEITFVEAALSGHAGLEDIDLYIDAWHDGDDDRDLHDYLGMTWDEYRLWVERPESLRYIISSRAHEKPIEAELFEQAQRKYALAARAKENQAQGVLDWLIKQKRV
ncbi:hypothetical protein ACFWTE_26345 [Nocardiopsis sp. NPDC058631]|uniref:hypothetical protein n=1 Tax=Nocardiopsis sp. NPDC058631 TaxID=3346566 RepID=UPI003654919E